MPRVPKSRLPELIEGARKSGLTFRDIQRRSGGQLPLSSLNAWHKNRPPNPNLTVETIINLARGMGLAPTAVFKAVIGEASSTLEDEEMQQVLEDFSRLEAKDREDLRLIVEMLRTEIQKRLDRQP